MRRAGIGVVGIKALLRLLLSVFFTTLAFYAARAEPVENPEDEVLIGTLDLRAPGSSRADAQDAVAGARAVDGSKPIDFYTQALQSLEAGDFASAQRLFEKTVAADPQGSRAAEARRHLGQLYTSARMPDSALSPPASPTALIGGTSDDRGLSPTNDEGPRELDDASRRGPESAADEERFVTQAGDRVFFSANSAELGARARAVLSAQAKWLVKRPEWNVIIEGHADDAALSAGDLDQLSQQRAQVVQQRLIAEGVTANRLSVVPWGRSAPIADCPETACQAQNRRAVSVLTPRRTAGQRQVGQNGGSSGAAAGLPLAARP